jgi:hypothetical protein
MECRLRLQNHLRQPFVLILHNFISFHLVRIVRYRFRNRCYRKDPPL